MEKLRKEHPFLITAAAFWHSLLKNIAVLLQFCALLLRKLQSMFWRKEPIRSFLGERERETRLLGTQQTSGTT